VFSRQNVFLGRVMFEGPVYWIGIGFVLIGAPAMLLYSVSRWSRLFRGPARANAVIGPLVATLALMFIGGGLVVLSFPVALGRSPEGIALLGSGALFLGLVLWRRLRLGSSR